jgi:hypothetical protein
MTKYSGFTLLEILLYVVIGGVTLVIASYSFVQINNLSATFRVNNELNQNGSIIIDKIQNLLDEADTLIKPELGSTNTASLVLRKGTVDITITQSTNDITVSYSDNSISSFKLNPTGILVTNSPNNSLYFQQINNQNTDNNNGITQSVKVKFTLKYNKPNFSTVAYDAEKAFETTLTLSKRKDSFQPILNTHPTGSNGVAYSLRRLSGFNIYSNQISSGYAGSAIRVRRGDNTGSSVYDNAEMDIGFTSTGELDKVALQNFVGYQNFLSYSEDISSTPGNWTIPNVSITADDTTAPDGSNTADRVTLSIGNNNKSIAKNTTIALNSDYTESYYVKANGYNFVQISPDTGFSSTAYQNYNLSNGSLGSSLGISAGQATIQSFGNGWYRISLTAKGTLTTSSGRMVLSIVSSASAPRLENINITTDTDSIFVWGAMRQLGATLKQYQKTTDKITTGEGYVTTWYDQSVSRRNATQATMGNQPKIVDGVTGIVTENGKPVIQFDGINDALTTSTFSNASNSTIFFVASRSANTRSFMARSTSYATLGATDLFNAYYLNKSNTIATNGSDPKNSLNLYTAIRTSAITNLTLSIGTGSAGNLLDGKMAELILYDQNKLDDRVSIETNIQEYYGTPLPPSP